MPGAITPDIRDEPIPPPGYVTITEFAKRAGVVRGALAKDVADGHFPLDRMCSVPWRGRYGKLVHLDTGYLAEYLAYRDVGRLAPNEPVAKPAAKKPAAKKPAAKKPAAKKPAIKKPKAKKPKTEKPAAAAKRLPDWQPFEQAGYGPPLIDEPPPRPVPQSADELLNTMVSLDTENTHTKSYWQIEHTRIKAIRAALELQKAKNEVLSVTQAAETLQQIVLVIKQTLLAIPGRVAPILSGEHDVIKIRDYLEREIKRALKELSKASKYQPQGAADAEG